MTDVELLRDAARVMRRRADQAAPPPWRVSGFSDVEDVDDDFVCHDTFTNADAEHIASWHPAVALAVAGLVDEVAGAVAKAARAGVPHPASGPVIDAAISVARAYLRRRP